MRLIFRIALPLVGLATMLVVGLAGAQTKKRVVELKAPVINEKEIKVECVHTYPHMILRSKINESAAFAIASEAKVKKTDCRQVGGRYVVAPGQRCTVFFEEESAGSTITQVSAETSSTRYAFNGNWPDLRLLPREGGKQRTRRNQKARIPKRDISEIHIAVK